MKYLSFLIILFSINSFSEDYKSAIRLKEGDVISADVFNDIMDRIELTLKPIVMEELIGTWTAKSYVCYDGDSYGASNYCEGFDFGTSSEGIFKVRSDNVTISDTGNNDGTFNWTSENFQLFVQGWNLNDIQHLTGGLSHICQIKASNIIGCVLDDKITTGGGSRITSFMNIKRTSPSQIVLFWGPDRGGNRFSNIILDKQAIAPSPPTSLSASLSGSSVSLTWTASEGGATSYTVKAKTSATGTYSDVVTNNSGTTYTDTLSSGTKWYRVFAVNSDGTSVGSNVVSVSR